MRRARAVAFVVASLCATGASAQVRHRRPMSPAPDVRYGFDNNGSAGGCRDYNCGSRCYDGHRGTDFPIGLGTVVVATADGTVVGTNNGCANYGGLGNTCGGRCGNYVQIQHADGTRTLFCHLQLNSLRVSRGQRVRCGQEIARSASSGNSTGPHLHLSWQRGGVSVDNFRGRCTSSPGMWTDQNPYPQSPGGGCACVPSAEVCDGRDNDCDGRVDEGLSRSCYTGPAGTQGRGVCRAGTQACSAGRWGACGGQVLPRAESCNRADDDCDGRVDDGVCAMDAGVPARDVPAARDVVDVVRGDVARGDVFDAGAPRDAVDVIDARTDDAPEEDVPTEDVPAEDVPAEDAVEFDDVPVDFDADVAPDDAVTDGGCGCRAGAATRRGSAPWALALLAVISLRRRRF